MLEMVMATAKSPSAPNIPDLELPVAQPTPKPKAAPVRNQVDWLDEQKPPNPVGTRAAAPWGDDFGDFGDFDDDLAGGGASGLEVSRSLAPTEEARQLPRGVTPDATEFELSPDDIARVGGYGAAPTNIVTAVPYAWRVLLRRRALLADVKQARQRLDQAETERDLALGAVARSWRDRLRQDGRFQAVLETAGSADRQVETESQALAGANTQYRERAENLGTRRTELERERTTLIDVESQRETALTAREAEHQRASAQLQRLQIVLRNAEQLEAQVADPTTGLTLPADHTATKAEAEAALPGAKANVQEHARRVKAATDHVKEARDATGAVTRKLRQLDTERRQLDAEFAKESHSRATLVADAQRVQRQAWAELARQLLAVELGKEISNEDANELLAHDASVARLAADNHRFLLALDSYDRAAVRRGFVASAVAAVLVVVLAGVLVYLAGSHRGADQTDPTDPYEVPEEEWE